MRGDDQGGPAGEGWPRLLAPPCRQHSHGDNGARVKDAQVSYCLDRKKPHVLTYRCSQKTLVVIVKNFPDWRDGFPGE